MQSENCHKVETAQEVRLLRLPEVMQVTGMRSRSTLYKWVSEGKFPKPITEGPRYAAWVSKEIQAWISAKVAQRDADKADG